MLRGWENETLRAEYQTKFSTVNKTYFAFTCKPPYEVLCKTDSACNHEKEPPIMVHFMTHTQHNLLTRSSGRTESR